MDYRFSRVAQNLVDVGLPQLKLIIFGDALVQRLMGAAFETIPSFSAKAALIIGIEVFLRPGICSYYAGYDRVKRQDRL